jgi:hypothetical protein
MKPMKIIENSIIVNSFLLAILLPLFLIFSFLFLLLGTHGYFTLTYETISLVIMQISILFSLTYIILVIKKLNRNFKFYIGFYLFLGILLVQLILMNIKWRPMVHKLSLFSIALLLLEFLTLLELTLMFIWQRLNGKALR